MLTQCLFLGYLGKIEPTKCESKWTIKASPTLLIVTWKTLTDVINFWCEHFWHYLSSNDRSSFHLTKCLLLHYLRKNRKWVRWKFRKSFDRHRQLCQKYWCRKLLKSDSPALSYSRKCPGCFFPDTVQILWAAHSVDLVILACVVLTQYRSVTDGRTDRRTLRRWLRRARHSAIARKNITLNLERFNFARDQ